MDRHEYSVITSYSIHYTKLYDPQVEQCKTYSLGAGTGFYNGETAIAVGGSVRVARNAIFKGGISFSTSESEPVGNAGIAFSW